MSESQPKVYIFTRKPRLDPPPCDMVATKTDSL